MSSEIKSFSTTDGAVKWIAASIPKKGEENVETAFKVNQSYLAVLVGNITPKITKNEEDVFKVFGISVKDSYISARIACLSSSSETLEIAIRIANALSQQNIVDTGMIDRAAVAEIMPNGMIWRIGEPQFGSSGLPPLAALTWKNIQPPKFSPF